MLIPRVVVVGRFNEHPFLLGISNSSLLPYGSVNPVEVFGPGFDASEMATKREKRT